MSQSPETLISYTASLITVLRQCIAEGCEDILVGFAEILDNAYLKPKGSSDALVRYAAMVILTKELANHLNDSSTAVPAALDSLYRRASLGLYRAMEGRTIAELNTDDYKPAEGGQWSDISRPGSKPLYHFTTAAQLEIAKMLKLANRQPVTA